MQAILAFEISYWENEYRKWGSYTESLVAMSTDIPDLLEQISQIMLECCDRRDEAHRKCEMFRKEYYDLTGHEYKRK